MRSNYCNLRGSEGLPRTIWQRRAQWRFNSYLSDRQVVNPKFHLRIKISEGHDGRLDHRFNYSKWLEDKSKDVDPMIQYMVNFSHWLRAGSNANQCDADMEEKAIRDNPQMLSAVVIKSACNDPARIKLPSMLTRYLSLGITQLKTEPRFHCDYLPMVQHVPVAQTSFWQHSLEDFACGEKDGVHGHIFCSLRLDGKVQIYKWVVEIFSLASCCRKLKLGTRLKKSRTPTEFLKELFKIACRQQRKQDIFLSNIGIEISECDAMRQSELNERTSLHQLQDGRPKGPTPLDELGLASSVSLSHSGTSLRPDALALGFNHFSITFDPKRILCIVAASNRKDDDSVQMIFFHKEGMAAFFGVGVSFAIVFLNANLEVEVEEVGEKFWTQFWMTSGEEFGSLALFESADFLSLPGRGVNLSTEDAALRFGVGVEGSTCVEPPGEAFESRAERSTERIKSPRWIKSLYQHLRRQTTSKDADDTEMMSAGEANKIFSDMASTSRKPALIYPSGSVPSHLDMFRSSGPFRLVNPDTEVHGNDYNNLLRLAVKVYLNPESYTFFSPSDRVDLVLATAMDMQKKFINPLTGEVIETVDTDICAHQMIPVVTITFLFDQSGKDVTKQMKTELAVEDNPHRFGWYHDKLKSSFKCMEPAAVRRETKDMATEVLSNHETRLTVRGQGQETSYALVKGKGGDMKIFGGSRSVFGAEFSLSGKRETTTSTTRRQDSSLCVQLTFLDKANFSIKRVDEGAELAYMATIYPSIKHYDLWNYEDRHLACESGMMSAVQLVVQGLWSVMDSDDTHVIPNRLCEYVFTCQRNFRMEKKVVEEVTGTTFLNPRKRKKPVEVIDDITIQQILSRNFLMNHSFSHMQRLRRPEEYLWDITHTPQAPYPVNAILS